MKIINSEKQTSVGASATSEDANFPVTNLFDDFPGNLYKAVAATQTATLRLPIAANAKALGIANTNATSGVCSLTKDSNEKELTDGVAVADVGGGLVSIPCAAHGYSQGDVVLIFGTDNYDGVHTLPTQAAGDGTHFIITSAFNAENVAATDIACEVEQTETLTLSWNRFWVDYTEITAAHKATIELTTTATTLQAGTFVAGGVLDIPNPRYDFEQYPIDMSIVKRYNNGAKYVKVRSVVRGFTVTLNLNRDTEFDELIELIESVSQGPVMILIAEDDDDDKWTCFGSISGIKGGHGKAATITNFTIEEEVY